MTSEVQVEIMKFLVEEFGIRRSKLNPSSRLLHDLGIDGDDAVELFEKIHQRYGTDFTGLYQSWHAYFGYEGIGWRTGVLVIFIAGFFGAASGALGLAENGALTVAFIGTATILWLAGVLSKPRMQPISVAEVVEAVERGAWAPRILSERTKA
jgi:hypothetical protein